MESPEEVRESKAFRWVGHLSEEELLGGPPAAAARPTAVSFQPHAVPVNKAVSAPRAPAVDPLTVPPRWRFQRRDLIAITAVAAAVWFALRGADGLPFQSTQVVPTNATEYVTNVALDRQELKSLPRVTNAANGSPGSESSGSGVNGSQTDRGDSGSKHHPKPPPDDTATPPLLKVTVPGVGTVTVNQPDVPDLPADTSSVPLPDTPSMPGTGDVLPGTGDVLP